MRSETSLRSRICCVNWRLIILLAVFLSSVHFILLSSHEVTSLRETPANSQSHSASTQPTQPGPKKFFEWHNLKAVSNASAHSAHSKLKNFSDWHNLKAASNGSAHSVHSKLKHLFDWHNLKGSPNSTGIASSIPEDTTSQGNINTKATTSMISDKLLSSAVASPTEVSPTAEEEAIDGTSNRMKTTGDGNTTEEYVAICLGVKDQSRDLGEWLTHHYYHVGIKRFYIMDDGSEPPLSTINLNHSIPESAITFHYQGRSTRAGAMQIVFYAQCNEWYGDNHTWIAYIDADEYLEVTSKTETLEDILKSFEADEMVGALGVNWKMHSSAGLMTRPESCRKAFTTCLNETYEGTHHEDHIKSIVKTSFFGGAQNPHKFGLRDGAMTVGENGDVIETIAWRVPPTRDRIALHHYAIKSAEEYQEKILRSNGMSDPKNEVFWNHLENLPHLECNEMAQYEP